MYVVGTLLLLLIRAQRMASECPTTNPSFTPPPRLQPRPCTTYRALCVGGWGGTGKGGGWWSSRPSQVTFVQAVLAREVWASVVNECGCPVRVTRAPREGRGMT